MRIFHYFLKRSSILNSWFLIFAILLEMQSLSLQNIKENRQTQYLWYKKVSSWTFQIIKLPNFKCIKYYLAWQITHCLLLFNIPLQKCANLPHANFDKNENLPQLHIYFKLNFSSDSGIQWISIKGVEKSRTTVTVHWT